MAKEVSERANGKGQEESYLNGSVVMVFKSGSGVVIVMP